jgi:PAS domain-containing protein
MHAILTQEELEILCRAQAELETSRTRYFDLYDLAPVSYCTVSEKGLILEVNLTTAILKEDHATYYQHCKHLFETHSTSSEPTGEPQACELRMVKKDGPAFWAHLEATAGRDAGGAPVCHIVMSDITERKRAEKEVVEALQQLQETRDMLIQFEKHTVVGRLATDVAHGILNPASIISSQLQFLEEENLSESARENVRVSREQLQRIVKISHDLSQSSAKKPGVLVGGDLRCVIEVGMQMTERRKEDHVQVEYSPLQRPSLPKQKWTRC